jgi:hypothetical protein
MLVRHHFLPRVVFLSCTLYSPLARGWRALFVVQCYAGEGGANPKLALGNQGSAGIMFPHIRMLPMPTWRNRRELGVKVGSQAGARADIWALD